MGDGVAPVSSACVGVELLVASTDTGIGVVVAVGREVDVEVGEGVAVGSGVDVRVGEFVAVGIVIGTAVSDGMLAGRSGNAVAAKVAGCPSSDCMAAAVGVGMMAGTCRSGSLPSQGS